MMSGSDEDKKHQSRTIKFDIFESTNNHCFQLEETDNKTVDIHKCEAIKRLLYALRYYSLLNIKDNASTHNIYLLTEFCVNVYGELLNDYEHIITIHSHQLQDINHQIISNHQFGECNMDKCVTMERLYNEQSPRTVYHDKSDKSLFMFYRDTLDSAHHYLYHLYDVGLRIKKQEMKQNDNELRITQKKRNNMGMRININKYNINTTNEDHNDKPFIDSLFETIHKYSTQHIDTLYHIIINQEYDTDAMMDDICMDHTASNIANYLKNDAFIAAIKQYMKSKKLHSVSFATGIIWFYWPYYKDLEEIHQAMSTNINDYGGYSIKQLFVTQKYNDFKREILVHISIDEYNDLILLKAKQYFSTNKVKSIVSNDYCKKGFLHYGIEANTAITIHHLISIILYCDLTQYCTSFSATFRSKSCFEPLSSIKKRNEEYWWMSKTLRETVEIYGYGNRWYHRRQEMGPFFSGVNQLMHVPSFSIRLCSPTSTTKQLQVAMHFANENGMIIQLNNNGHRRSDMLLMFDCSWISKYKEEDERLIFGGYEKIRIESIRIESINFEIYFHSLFILDSMLNGTRIKQIEITKKDIFIITKLLSFDIDGMPLYIQQCFELFCKNKLQIIINIHYLNQCFKKEINGFIMESLEQTNTSKNNVPIMEEDITSDKNLLIPHLFAIFPNIREIHIGTTSSGGGESYIFSLSKLLDIITADNMPQWTLVTIKAIRNRGNNNTNSWIHNLFSSSDIKSLYIKSNLQMDLTQITPHPQARGEDILSIKRLI